MMHSLFADFALAHRSFELIRANNGRQCPNCSAWADSICVHRVNMPEMSGMEGGRVRAQQRQQTRTLMSGNSSAAALEIGASSRSMSTGQTVSRRTGRGDLKLLPCHGADAGADRGRLATVRASRKVLDSSIFNIDITEAGDGAPSFMK